MNELTYIIADENQKIIILEGIKVFGKKVSMLAIFKEEQDALDILFAIQESRPDFPPHSVIRIESQLTVSVSTY